MEIVGKGELFSRPYPCTNAWIRRTCADQLTFVITGSYPGADGDEDAALADYVEARLHEESIDETPYLDRVHSSIHGRRASNSGNEEWREDLIRCAELDRFDFSMPVSRQDGLLILRAARATC
jgi:2-phosphosulfolactate phosphatase